MNLSYMPGSSSGSGIAMAEERDREVRRFALRHGLTEEQARRVLEEHGEDESRWSEAARSLIHFLKSPG